MVVRREWISVLSDPTTLCVEYTLESKEKVMQSYSLRHVHNCFYESLSDLWRQWCCSICCYFSHTITFFHLFCCGASDSATEIATEHLIAHGCRLITAVSLHCKLSLTRLLQSIAVILYPHEYVEGFVYNESE